MLLTDKDRRKCATESATRGARYGALHGVTCNVHVAGRWLDRHTPIGAEARTLSHSAGAALELSAVGKVFSTTAVKRKWLIRSLSCQGGAAWSRDRSSRSCSEPRFMARIELTN